MNGADSDAVSWPATAASPTADPAAMPNSSLKMPDTKVAPAAPHSSAVKMSHHGSFSLRSSHNSSPP